jgi:hypothetical protein
VAAEARRLADLAFPHAPDEVVVRAVVAWTQLFGMISFELFGHFHSVIELVEPVVERSLLETGRMVGFPPPWRGDSVATGPTGSEPVDPAAPTDEDDEAFYLI